MNFKRMALKIKFKVLQPSLEDPTPLANGNIVLENSFLKLDANLMHFDKSKNEWNRGNRRMQEHAQIICFPKKTIWELS